MDDTNGSANEDDEDNENDNEDKKDDRHYYLLDRHQLLDINRSARLLKPVDFELHLQIIPNIILIP